MTKSVYELDERTARVGEDAIDFAKTIPQGTTTNRIINQLLSAATSVGFHSSFVIRHSSFW